MYTVNKLLHYLLAWSKTKCTFYNNYTCRFIVVICFVYMDDNRNYLFSFVFNKTETKCILIFLMSFDSENSLLLLYVTRIRVN